MFTLLIVEDDTAIREMLTHFLTTKGFDIKSAEDGKQTLEILRESTPDLILLDWMLPDTQGPSLLKKIRRKNTQSDIPIIMLTARAEETDKIEGLNVGADDYMTKPVSLHELHARINALLRRAQGLNEDKIILRGSIKLDPDNNILKIKDETVKIGQIEFRLLHFFLQNPERLYSRTQLLDRVWGQNTFIEERTVDVHVLRLRKVLKPYGMDRNVQTVRGVGYRYSLEQEAETK